MYEYATCTYAYTSLTGNPAEARLRRHEAELHVAGGREELGPGRRQHDAVVVGEETSLRVASTQHLGTVAAALLVTAAHYQA